MAQNRHRILEEAARLFRDKGFDAVSIAEVMKAAGLTHGGFYGHFRSKHDLIAAAISHAQDNGSAAAADASGNWLDAYLSPAHRDHPQTGCQMAALAGLMRDQSPQSRAAMAQRLVTQLDTLAATMPGPDAAARRRAAIGSWSAMIGALILSRSIDDPDLSNELLCETRAWLNQTTHPLPKPQP